MLRKTYKTTTIELEENMMNKIADTAQRIGVPKIRIIRECIEKELPRLIDREVKADKRRDTKTSEAS